MTEKDSKLYSLKYFHILETLLRICDRYEIIAGQSYCIKKRNITLNSCGKKSDWPCMEASGCLNIDHFLLNVIDE